MTIRNLDAIFRPRSIALIGASPRPNSVGLVTLQNLLGAGFGGSIFPVNPKHESIAGMPAYADVAGMPAAPDLAVICTPPRTIPGLIRQLAERGTKGGIVITAGFREVGSEEGRALEQEMLDAARPHLFRIIGPNCLGVLSTPAGLNASFAPGNAKRGSVAFVAQSGAIVTTVLDWANARGIGFSHLVSLGDMADVDFGDMLDYLANDPATNAVLLYIEAVTQARKFVSAARAAARLKPVIAIKAGRHAESARAAMSHTGALAGMDEVYGAAFRRAGILRVRNLEEIFDAVTTLAAAPTITADDLVILTNGGGAGVLATDALLDLGGTLTELTATTVARLDRILPPTWSRANPVDIIGDAPPDRYAGALTALLEAPETHAVLVINCPTAVASSADAARAVAKAAGKKKAVLANWLGADTAGAARAAFATAGLPVYDTPAQAVRGFMHLVHYRRGQEIIVEVPSSSAAEFAPDDGQARRVIAQALAQSETWLNAGSIQGLLTSYGIPAARATLAATPDEAAARAHEFARPVALKIVSPDITHKSDVGGVMLGLEGAEEVRTAASAMLARVAKAAPAARLEGFLVQEMIHRPGAFELIAGMAVDRQFGPFILFGQGGTAVEVVADKALALPPLNMTLARELMTRTRIFRQLRGYRNRAAADLDALALTLVKLSQLVCDHDEIQEFELNPLLADAQGVVALDARVRLAPLAPDGRRGGRLTIRPYPKELEREESLSGLGRLRLRPIRPEDAPALARLITSLAPEDARLRFFTPLRSLDPGALARLTQIDYEREMAFVLERQAAGSEPLLAAARIAADPDNVRAEFAIVVRSDLHRRGLGRLLMQRMIEYARGRGLLELTGEILGENRAMLALCSELGFLLAPEEGGRIVRAMLQLQTASRVQ